MNKIIAKNSKMKIINNNAFIMDYFSFLGLILIVIIFAILTDGRLLNSKNLMNIFNNFFSIGLGAMSVVFLMSLGELDLSVGAILGLSAALSALSSKISMVTVFPVAVLTGLLIGLLNGFIIARLKVASFIATLAMSFVARGVTTFLLNGSIGMPISLRVFDNNALKIAVFVLILFAFYTLFEFRSYGKRCRAVGSSSEAARQSGVNVEKTRMLAFMISGIICGLLGFFSLARTCTASSKTGNAFEFDVLLAVLFGGMLLTGGWQVKFRSAVIGSIAMAVMHNGMSLLGITGQMQQLIQGILIIVIVCITFDRRNL
jgi:ribose transport system permease protein